MIEPRAQPWCDVDSRDLVIGRVVEIERARAAAKSLDNTVFSFLSLTHLALVDTTKRRLQVEVQVHIRFNLDGRPIDRDRFKTPLPHRVYAGRH